MTEVQKEIQKCREYFEGMNVYDLIDVIESEFAFDIYDDEIAELRELAERSGEDDLTEEEEGDLEDMEREMYHTLYNELIGEIEGDEDLRHTIIKNHID